MLKSRLLVYLKLMRFHQPIGILLLLWPTLWGLWIAGEGRPQPKLIVIFVLGAILMRAGGCAMNDFADRHFDLHVQRTQNRPLAAGQLTGKHAVLTFLICSSLALALVLLTNALTIMLAAIGFMLASIYPFLKRYTHFPQAWLGIAFSWGIPMAYAAQAGSLSNNGWWLLFLAAIAWSISYDTFYAMADRDDDLKIGLKSTAVLFGHYDRMITARIQLTMLILLLLFGWMQDFNYWYYLGLLVVACFMGYQQYLIKDRLPELCLQAFRNNNWVGGTVFFALLLNYIYQ